MTHLDDLTNGAVLTATRTVSDADIDACAELTGDFGLHHVAGLAGRRIAQGLLVVAVAPLLRGEPDFALRAMSLTFRAPVYSGDTVTASVRVSDADTGGSGEFGLELSVRNQDDVEVVTGTGVGVVHPPAA